MLIKSTIDHLVYGTQNLETSIKELARRTGVTAIIGGRHEGLGTHNALLGLGDGCYLEIIAPDPGAPAPGRPRPFGLDQLREPALISWAVRPDNIGATISAAKSAGYDAGPLIETSRQTPEGQTLNWQLTLGAATQNGGPLPFLIDWLDTPHPSLSAPRGCSVSEIAMTIPNPVEINFVLKALGLDPIAQEGERFQLSATLNTPKGVITLR